MHELPRVCETLLPYFSAAWFQEPHLQQILGRMSKV